MRDAYADSSEPGAWVDTVARMRTQPLIADVPQSALAQPVTLVGGIAAIAALGWLAVFAPDNNVATAFFRAFAGDYWSWLTLGISIAVVVSIYLLFSSTQNQQRFAIGFDVLAYWPRRHHPLAPPPYADLVTLRLKQVVDKHAANGDRLILVGHSQGSVLAYTALQRSTPEARATTDLVTCGCPLVSLYAASFPGYFSTADFVQARTTIGILGRRPPRHRRYRHRDLEVPPATDRYWNRYRKHVCGGTAVTGTTRR